MVAGQAGVLGLPALKTVAMGGKRDTDAVITQSLGMGALLVLESLTRRIAVAMVHAQVCSNYIVSTLQGLA